MKWRSFSSKLRGYFKSGQLISENLDITKYILKEAFIEDLPKEILERKKIGFPVPLNEWFTPDKIDNLIDKIINGPILDYKIIDKNNFISWANDIKGELSVKQGIQLWMFYNINSWINKYNKYIE